MSTLSQIETRYPQLAFLIQCSDLQPSAFSNEEVKVDLEGVEALFIYGLASDALYSQLKGWLHEKPQRDLILIEDDLSVIGSIRDEALIDDPQVHIRYILPGSSLKNFAAEIAAEFPIHHMAVACLKSKSRARFRQLSLWLKRKLTLAHALFNEDFYYHELFKNLLPNFKRIEGASYVHNMRGAFAGTPAVICGAGPSLDTMLPELRTLENQALIFAGGSTITALTTQGVQPHFGVAIDPNPEEYERLRPNQAREMPLIFASRVNPRIFETLTGPFGYLRSFTGGAIEQWLEEELGFTESPLEEKINPEALSVTTTCIGLAQYLGCAPIYLCGIDLAYTGLKRYAKGVMAESGISIDQLKRDRRASERYLKRKGQNGKMVHTLVKWVMESHWISHFAKKHPGTRYINLTDQGLGFKGIPVGRFESPSTQPKLREKVLQMFRETKLSHLSIPDRLIPLEESFKRCAALLDEIIARPELEFVVQDDLEKEIAYALALSSYAGRLAYALKRRYRFDEASQKSHFYTHLRAVAASYLSTFDKNRGMA